MAALPHYAFVLVPVSLPKYPVSLKTTQGHRSLHPNRVPLKCCVAHSPIAFVLSHFEAFGLLALKKHVQRYPILVQKSFYVDIGTRLLDQILVCQDGISIPDSNNNSDHTPKVVATWSELKKMSKKGKAGAFECYLDGKTTPTRIASISDTTNRTASLHPCAPGKPPTLILGGFGMHRLKDTDPGADTDAKMKAVGKQHLKGRVLDICTGLGYTAIAAAEVKDVTRIMTIELDPMVISMQRRNPWSRALFISGKINRIEGDATIVLSTVPESHFDVIIHDPPAQAMAGELYSTAFYKQLKRVSKHGARIFHYIGDPSSQESGKLYRGVMRRLSEVGFAEIEKDTGAFGVIARAG